ncbi:MAG: hypothetical protein MJ208_02255 [Bacilli bacterium]|nr:hypothetical protein [Bacilli bacterium]
MKKKIFFLLIVPILCLVSCSENAITTPVTYRNNFIKQERYSDNKLTNVITAEYDENGLATKIVDKPQGLASTSICECHYTFDDKRREIRHEEIITMSPDDSKNIKSSADNKTIIMVATREYDGDFVAKETHNMWEYENNILINKVAALTYKHRIEDKNGYSVLILQATSLAKMDGNIEIDTASSLQFTIQTYDKQERDTGSLTFTINEVRQSSNDFARLTFDFAFNSIVYKSNSDNSNDYYAYFYTTKGIKSSNSYHEKTHDEIFVIGSETYSDKNLLVECQEERQELITLDLELTSRKLEYKYDDLDRLIYEKAIISLYDNSGTIKSTDVSTTDYTYTNNDKNPTKTVTNNEYKDEQTQEVEKSKAVETVTFDEYGRILSDYIEQEKSSGVILSERTDNEYGDPIIVPEGEILIEEELEETSLF